MGSTDAFMQPLFVRYFLVGGLVLLGPKAKGHFASGSCGHCTWGLYAVLKVSKLSPRLGVGMHACSSRNWEIETRGSGVQCQPRLYTGILRHKTPISPHAQQTTCEHSVLRNTVGACCRWYNSQTGTASREGCKCSPQCRSINTGI